jgi:exopolysaccharide production protein ExoQ
MSPRFARDTGRGVAELRGAAPSDAPERLPPRSPGWREFLDPEKLAAVAVLFWMSQPVAPLIPNLDDSLDAMFSLPVNSLSAPSGMDDQFLRLSWYPVYVVVLALANRHWGTIWAFAKRNAPLVLLLGWTLLTTLWSVSPADTLRRGAALSLTTTFAIYLAVRFDTLWVARLTTVALSIDVVGSAICALAFPSVGISHDAEYAGAWRGVFANKNALGAMMLITCLGFATLYLADRRRIYLVGLAGAFALLVLSTSMTPVFIMLALVPCLALVRRYFLAPRGFATFLALALSVAGIVFLLASTMIEPILALFGRDTTFTGRTDIWNLSWDAIQQRYWAGYGYGAFWSNRWGPASDIWDTLNWRVPSSHSGLLEMWLGLGLIGVILFGALLARSLSEILSRAAQGTVEEALWRIGYLLIFIVHSMTEPTAMDQTSLSWALFVTVITGGSRIGAAGPGVRSPSPVASALTARPADAARRRPAGAAWQIRKPRNLAPPLPKTGSDAFSR